MFRRQRATCVKEEMAQQSEKVIQQFRNKKKVQRLGTAILSLDKKVASGEKLTAEEQWLFAKANAQAKAGNKMYARQSKVYQSGNKGEGRAALFKRPTMDAMAEDDEEESDEEEEDDSLPFTLLNVADRRLAERLAHGPGAVSKFDYLADDGNTKVSDVDKKLNQDDGDMDAWKQAGDCMREEKLQEELALAMTDDGEGYETKLEV